MGRLRRHVTYANVASTLALVFAVGGGGVYAAGKIGGGEIKKGAVSSPQIKNRQVRRQDIAGGSINSRKVSNQSLTGKDVDDDSLSGHDILESSLGPVPVALALNGLTARMVRASKPSGGGASQVLSQAGLTVSLSCPAGAATIELRGAASGDFGAVVDPSGGVQQFSPGSPQTTAVPGTGTATVRRADGTLTRLDYDLLSLANGFGTQDDCFLSGLLLTGK